MCPAYHAVLSRKPWLVDPLPAREMRAQVSKQSICCGRSCNGRAIVVPNRKSVTSLHRYASNPRTTGPSRTTRYIQIVVPCIRMCVRATLRSGPAMPAHMVRTIHVTYVHEASHASALGRTRAQNPGTFVPCTAPCRHHLTSWQPPNAPPNPSTTDSDCRAAKKITVLMHLISRDCTPTQSGHPLSSPSPVSRILRLRAKISRTSLFRQSKGREGKDRCCTNTLAARTTCH